MRKNIYVDLLLIALKNKCDFANMILESDAYVEKVLSGIGKSEYMPKGYEGICFVEHLAELMGSSLSEVYSLTKNQRKNILTSILRKLESEETSFGQKYRENSDGIELQSSFSVLKTSDEDKIKHYYESREDEGQVQTVDNIYYTYIITFQKKYVGENESQYVVTISLPEQVKSRYICYRYSVWSEKKGIFSDYIEKAISMHKQLQLNAAESGNSPDAVYVSVEKSILNPQEVKFPYDKEELIAEVFDDTKTIELLDKFEGDDEEEIRYRRLVIKNVRYRDWSDYVGYNLVIERGPYSDYVGNITFTEFKKEPSPDVIKYIKSVVSDDIISLYNNRDKFYRFPKPFLLRAQNSSNRMGYGWASEQYSYSIDAPWGTLYGETTNYFIVGAYITTTLHYDPMLRHPFEGNVSTDKQEENPMQRVRVKTYRGKLKETTANPTEVLFIEIGTSPDKKSVPISYDRKAETLYITEKVFSKYKNIISSGNVKFTR